MDLAEIAGRFGRWRQLRRARWAAFGHWMGRWSLRRSKMQSGWIELSPQEWRVYFALNRLSWAITGLTLLGVLGTVLATPLRFSGALIPLQLIVTVGFGTVFLFYLYIRKDPFIIILSNSIALLAAFSFAGALSSYTGQFWGAGFPLSDARLARADQLLGFDWLASLIWLNRHPALSQILNLAYNSPVFQLIALLPVQFIFGMHRRFQVYMLAIQITILVTVAVSAVLPALGPHDFYRINAATHHPDIGLAMTKAHVEEVLNLRGANPILPVDQLNAIITFPSFHTVVGILSAWAFWPVRGLRWTGLILNAAMIAATPLSGAHYFVDVIAGIGVAWMGLWLAAKITRRVEARDAVSAQARPFSDLTI